MLDEVLARAEKNLPTQSKILLENHEESRTFLTTRR
jgi:hypothetical protein